MNSSVATVDVLSRETANRAIEIIDRSLGRFLRTEVSLVHFRIVSIQPSIT